MARNNTAKYNVMPGMPYLSIPLIHYILDPVDELFDMINVNKKPYLVQNDFIDFFEGQDFPSGMDTFDTNKYFNYVEGNPSRVTKLISIDCFTNCNKEIFQSRI